ncbi:hypothetical protein C2E23DRAFT_889291 [Lenzites betulinus]|nr:hypothetical protein C2E23DRAFT_889291 [Lenzites betulinus]
MQFTATFATLALALVASVAALPSYSSSTTNSQCNTGPVQCCNSVQPAKSEGIMSMLKALDILDQVGENDQVGLTCSPINASSVGGSQSCDAAPVCCNGNSYGGLSLGCAPIEANGL